MTTLEVGPLKNDFKFMHKDTYISEFLVIEEGELANIFMFKPWPLHTSCITRYPGGQNIY